MKHKNGWVGGDVTLESGPAVGWGGQHRDPRSRRRAVTLDPRRRWIRLLLAAVVLAALPAVYFAVHSGVGHGADSPGGNGPGSQVSRDGLIGGHTYDIVNVNSKLSIGSAGSCASLAGLVQGVYGSSPTPDLQWTVTMNTDGTLALINRCQFPSGPMSITHAPQANDGDQVSLYPPVVNSRAAEWVISPAGPSGNYHLVNVSSKNYLGVRDAGLSPGAVIQEAASSGAADQSWIFVDVSNSTPAATSTATGKASPAATARATASATATAAASASSTPGRNSSTAKSTAPASTSTSAPTTMSATAPASASSVNSSTASRSASSAPANSNAAPAFSSSAGAAPNSTPINAVPQSRPEFSLAPVGVVSGHRYYVSNLSISAYLSAPDCAPGMGVTVTQNDPMSPRPSSPAFIWTITGNSDGTWTLTNDCSLTLTAPDPFAATQLIATNSSPARPGQEWLIAGVVGVGSLPASNYLVNPTSNLVLGLRGIFAPVFPVGQDALIDGNNVQRWRFFEAS